MKNPHTRKKRWDILNGGHFALGLTIGILLTVLSVFLGSAFEVRPTREEWIDIAPALFALVVAITSTFIAILSLAEQQRSREAGTDPVVLAHFSQREDARNLIMFTITNVGAGAAMNIRLKVTLPEGFDPTNKLLTNIFERHEPIRVLPQERSISFNLGMGFILLEPPIMPPFHVSLTYEDIEGKPLGEGYLLDIREMEKLGSEKSPQMRLVSALETIAKKLN